ncbi:MAG: hypothetical protein C5B50_10575 [Verrucomicrobia bacterium]|nr:MAG: hypothetical protein C5B50_10575 [Verrucomicrobiota bacterium]
MERSAINKLQTSKFETLQKHQTPNTRETPHKHQTPNTKHQRNTKLQTSNPLGCRARKPGALVESMVYRFFLLYISAKMSCSSLASR